MLSLARTVFQVIYCGWPALSGSVVMADISMNLHHSLVFYIVTISEFRFGVPYSSVSSVLC